MFDNEHNFFYVYNKYINYFICKKIIAFIDILIIRCYYIIERELL